MPHTPEEQNMLREKIAEMKNRIARTTNNPEYQERLFNLEKHLLELAGDYCENAQEKAELLDRIRQGANKNPRKEYPVEWFHNIDDAYPPESDGQQKNEPTVKALLDQFANGKFKANKDLKKLLADSKVKIVIRNNNKVNANALLEKRPGQPNQVTIAVCTALFEDANKEILPGLLAHEMGHLLDYSKRPQGHEADQAHACETFADVTGTHIAVGAGLDPRPFGRYMGNHYRRTLLEFDDSPRGNYREETFEKTYNVLRQEENTKTQNDTTKNFSLIREKQMKLHS